MARRAPFLIAGVLAVGGLTAAPSATTAIAASAPCPAGEIRRIWDGGSSADKRCMHIPDRLDHLFYPGYQTTRAAHESAYRENTVFIQLRLRDLGYRPIAIDGYFGKQSEQHVRNFQRNRDAIVDGKVGPQTWQKLFGLGSA